MPMMTSNKTRDLNFGLSLHLHPYFVYAGSQGSGESAHDLAEPSLLADAISSDVLGTGPNVFSVCVSKHLYQFAL